VLVTDRLNKLEDLKQKIRECKDCRLCETRIKALPGEGNPNARVVLIAQAPGQNEDREGRMFIGPSGKKLDELLQEADVDRQKIYVTNLVKCMLPKYRKPNQDEIDKCSQHLTEEIKLVNPSVIATLGYYSTKYIFDYYQIPLPHSTQNLSNIYGLLHFADNKKMLLLRHPASLLYTPSLKKEMTGNYRKLKTLMSDCKWFSCCPMKRFYEEGKIQRKWIELYCKGDWKRCVRYYMEEKGKPHPDWLLPDGSIDYGLSN